MHTFAVAIASDRIGYWFVNTQGKFGINVRSARKFSTAADATLFIEDHPEVKPPGCVLGVVGLVPGWDRTHKRSTP